MTDQQLDYVPKLHRYYAENPDFRMMLVFDYEPTAKQVLAQLAHTLGYVPDISAYAPELAISGALPTPQTLGGEATYKELQEALQARETVLEQDLSTLNKEGTEAIYSAGTKVQFIEHYTLYMELPDEQTYC